jgi:SAM-dependent methyltransferase
LQILINKSLPNGHLDSVVIEPSGIMTVTGWTPSWNSGIDLELSLDDQPLTLVAAYRYKREDVSASLRSNNPFLGVIYEYFIPRSLSKAKLEIIHNGSSLLSTAVHFIANVPHYLGLLTDPAVKSRNDIYSYGPPAEAIASEVLRLSELFYGRVLDFGCGRGNLVVRLRERGIDAYGIEIDRIEIKASLLPGAAEVTTLYDGSIPLPYEDGHFDCTAAIEVIEHVSPYYDLIRELARVTKHRLIVTVPDISAIPRCFPQHVVPWHLLESTHVNFFNQHALAKALYEFFSSVTILKIGVIRVNESQFFESIAAICEK